jgi:murein L,D-transpeptidase YcbB/YkuD
MELRVRTSSERALVNRTILILIPGILCAFPASTASGDTDCETALCRLVTATGHTDTPEYDERIRKFYEPGYTLAWTRGGAATDQAKALIDALRRADDKGLNADDYEGTQLDGRLSQLDPARNPPEPMLAEFDLTLTAAAMRFVSDLHFGRANPGLFHAAGGANEELADLPAFLRQRLVDAADVKTVLDSLEPPYPGYRRTRQALQNYIALARQGTLPTLNATLKPVEPDGTYSDATPLAAILRRLGDFPADAPDPVNFDGALVDAVRQFQRRHGLDPNGRIGKTTLAELNTPLTRRILQLRLSMERWRWVPHSFPRPPVVVNIPEFRLRALNAAWQTDLEMKVVVGSAYGGHKTPVFSADMKYVVFRPYWDVPFSIARAEIAPKLAKDHSYLEKNRYELVDAQGRIAIAPVNDAAVAQIRSGALRVRQTPGPENALGLVKFLFPNEYNVYLHSTPAQELFSKTRRDFSHGCIRVEKPEDLAVWVLQNKPEWTPARIHAAMNGAETLQVTLDTPIPVLIVYATAVVLESGEVRFFDDIYQQDAQLEQALAKVAQVR